MLSRDDALRALVQVQLPRVVNLLKSALFELSCRVYGPLLRKLVFGGQAQVRLHIVQGQVLHLLAHRRIHDAVERAWLLAGVRAQVVEHSQACLVLQAVTADEILLSRLARGGILGHGGLTSSLCSRCSSLLIIADWDVLFDDLLGGHEEWIDHVVANYAHTWQIASPRWVVPHEWTGRSRHLLLLLSLGLFRLFSLANTTFFALHLLFARTLIWIFLLTWIINCRIFLIGLGVGYAAHREAPTWGAVLYEALRNLLNRRRQRRLNERANIRAWSSGFWLEICWFGRKLAQGLFS